MAEPSATRPVRSLWKTWGDNIRQAREEQDPRMSQFELALRVGVRPQQISQMERGTSRGTDTVRLAIAEALGRDPNELFAYPSDADAAEVVS